MNHCYDWLKRFLFFFCALLITNVVLAQEMTVNGKVTDANAGDVLPGVTVSIKGTTQGAITNFDGIYTLKAKQGDVLVFSFIGYTSVEVVVSGASHDVALQLSTRDIDEVVVVGYGTVKKKDATGSVVAIGSDDFNKGSITSPQELLMGKAAGVVITTASGAPGAGATIRIRGGSSLTASNDPLIVIDGMPVDNGEIRGISNALTIVNPNDIETFTVLKDASATAIYGSRASNGVILITTKKGKVGKGMRISYNGNVSVSNAIDFVDVYSGDEFRQMAYEHRNLYDPAGLAVLGTENTDWQKEIFQTAVSSDHNISVAGAAGNLPYRVSLGYTDQEGILINTGIERTTVSASIDPILLDGNLKINVNVKGMSINNNFGNTDAIGSAIGMDPTQPVMNGNTSYGGYYAWTDDYSPNGTSTGFGPNPVAQANIPDNGSNVKRFIGNFQADYKMPFLPELRANLNLAYDYANSDGHNNVDTIASWMRRGVWGQLQDYNGTNFNSLIESYLNYNKELTSIKSRIDVTAGYSWQHFKREGDTYTRSMVDEKHPKLPASDSSSFATENYLISFFGRLNYTLLDKYLLTFTIREDGSSRFAEGNRWGLFPSAAFAWKLKEESFLKDVNFVTDLKLRLGWGVTGQQNIGNDYPAQAKYRDSELGRYYQFGNQFIPTLRPDAYDPDIKWEETTTQNIGLDYSFADDRIVGSFDLYMRETIDLLNNIAIPNGSNFSNYLTTNVGTLVNKGFEATLAVRPIAKKDMGLTVGFNFTYNVNEITKLNRTNDPNYAGVPAGTVGMDNVVKIHSVGYPVNSFYLNQQVYDSNGNPVEGVYVDLSGKGGAIYGIASNKYRYKNQAPDYLMGVSLRFNYKSFDLAASSRISIGNYVYNANAAGASYDIRYALGYWANAPKFLEDTKFVTRQFHSDYFVENASFFKLDNVSAGYNFDNLMNSKISARLSLSAQNLLTITNYTGLDPEVDGGIDNNFYPRPRMFILGLNLTF